MIESFSESAGTVEYGLIDQVRLETLGATMRTAHTAGTTTITVSDAGDFNAAGGQVAVTSYPAGVESVNVYAYDSVDFENDTIHLTTGLVDDGDEGDWVGVIPTTMEKHATVVLDVGGEAISARVPHALYDRLVDGVREDDDREECAVRLVNDTWVVADVLGVPSTMRSANWDGGSAGWELGNETAQFPSANIIGELGAGQGTFDTLSLQDVDLGTKLDAMPQGLLVLAQASNTVSTAAVTAETIMFQFDFGTFTAGRRYLMMCRVTMTNSNDPADVYTMHLRFTTSTVSGTSATTPTLTSAVMDGSKMEFGPTTQLNRPQVNHFWVYSPATDFEDLKAALTVERTSGTAGTAQIKADDPNFQFQVFVIDIGKPANLITTIAQKSKNTGTPDADPVTTYTRSWVATDSQSYDGDLGKRQGDASTPDCYQGYYSGTHGNTRSLLSFNDADIRAKLAGATIRKVELGFRVKHSYENSGLDVRIRQHNHATLPSTYSSGAEIATKADAKAGTYYVVTLPNSVGNDFKNSNAKGLGFGPGPTTNKRYFGYIYGKGSGIAPVLTITYDK